MTSNNQTKPPQSFILPLFTPLCKLQELNYLQEYQQNGELFRNITHIHSFMDCSTSWTFHTEMSPNPFSKASRLSIITTSSDKEFHRLITSQTTPF